MPLSSENVVSVLYFFRTELVVYVYERPSVGPAKRFTATELFTALSSPLMKPQVTAQLAAESITKKALSKEELKLYLDTPPAGKNFKNVV